MDQGAAPRRPDFIWSWQLDGQRWPEGLAGLMAMGSDMPADAPPYWQVYLAVEKLDEAIEKTNGAGGRGGLRPAGHTDGRVRHRVRSAGRRRLADGARLPRAALTSGAGGGDVGGGGPDRGELMAERKSKGKAKGKRGADAGKVRKPRAERPPVSRVRRVRRGAATRR